MASIAFVITNSDGSVASKTATVADADVGRFIAWGLSTFSMPNDDAGIPVSERTPSWAVNRWIELILSDAFASVHAFEIAQASAIAQQHAVAAIKPIALDLK